MHINVLLPAITAATGMVFVGVLVARYARQPRAHLLAWTLGILWYAIAAATEALGGALGWTPSLYRAWYITGALGVAAYLGAGTVYLHREAGFRSLTVVCLLLSSAPALATGHLAIGFTALGAAMLLTLVLSARPTWFAHAVFVTLLLTTLVAAVLVAAAPLDLAGLPRSADQVVSGQALDPDIRALTPPLNLSGAVLLLLGALGSAIAYARRRAEPRRVAANVLIAAGAFVPSVASGLTRFGVTSLFFVGELLGLVCILAGFMLSRGSALR